MAVTKTDWSKPASDPVNQDAIMSAAADMYMASPQVDPAAAALQTLDRMQSTIDASKARDAERYRLEVESAILLDNIIAEEAKRREAARMMGINSPLGMGGAGQEIVNRQKGMRADMMRQSLPAVTGSPYGPPAVTGSPFVDRYTGMQGTPYPSYLGTTLEEVGNLQNRGLLGSYMRGIVDEGRAFDPRFDMSMPEGYRLRGMTTTRDMFGIPVSTYTGLPDPTYTEPDEEVVPPVADPETGREKCPEGYIFDEDLQACRLDTGARSARAAGASTAPLPPGAMYARTGLLDVAPEGLMGFRERYGAGFGTPSDFGAANLAFRQQAAISPEYFETPRKLTGYTLLD